MAFRHPFRPRGPHAARPAGVASLLARAAPLWFARVAARAGRRSRAWGRRRLVVWALSAVALSLAPGLCAPRPALRVATFNIENFPKSPRQEAGAFDTIRGLEVAALGVQEITDPDAFAAAARRRLGEAWRFVFAERGPTQRVGVLFDGGTFDLLSTTTHRDTEVYPGAKPTFEARLGPGAGRTSALGGGEVLRLLVVHLKAQGDGADLRQKQLRALRPVFAAALASGERVVLLGDFNATGESDRAELGALAVATGATWASEDLPCTSYWARPDGCRGSALDHVFTWAAPRRALARGPCESEGCEPGERCPIFRDEVSDHCPVVVELP